VIPENPMSAATQQQGKTRYVYDLGSIDRAPPAPCSAAVEFGTGGVTVAGGRASVALLRAPRGSSTALQTGETEQFLFVLQGRLDADIDRRIVAVPAQHALHVPAGMPHALHAAEDSFYLVAVSRGTQAPARHAWRAQAAGMAAARTQPVTGGSVRLVYAIDELEAVPPGASSAKVVPKNFVSGKSSSFGAALSGAALHVGVIHKARGSGAKLHTHPNEQFNVVLEGKLLGEIDGAPMEVTPYGLIHMPPGVRHCTMASAEGDLTVFVVKDTSHGLSGPPVDGIEDGPRYLPGFGPQGAGNK
jgi:quercetin dioxygenase-like cupin family protein